MPSFPKVVFTAFFVITATGSFMGLLGPSIVAADAAGPRVFPSIEQSVLTAVPALAAEKAQVAGAATAYKAAKATASKVDRSDIAAAAAEDRPVKGSQIVDLSNCGGATTVQLSQMIADAGGEPFVCSKY